MRKNIIRTFLAALLIASMLSVPAWAESAVVTGNEVNLREGPGSTYRVIGSLPRDTVVNVVDRSNGSWVAVEYGNTIGFLSSDYLRITDEGQEIYFGFNGSGELSFSGSPWGTSDAMGSWTEPPAEQPSQGEVNFGQPAQPTQNEGNSNQPQQPSQGEVSFGQPEQQTQSGQTAGQSASASAQEGTKGMINAMYVRFRSGPDSNASILGEFNKGKVLVAMGTVGNWTACVIDGKAGYVFSDYVTLDENANAGTATVTAPVQNQPQIVDSFGGMLPAGAVTAPTASAAPASAQKIGTGVISGNYVRFRTGPGTNYSIIDSYDNGTALDITGTSGDWTACVIDGRAGYINSNYVRVTGTSAPASSQPEAPAATPAPTPVPVPTATPAPASKKGYVSGNNVRMRDGASMSAGILTELFYGNNVTITGTVGDWTAVEYNGQAGYIYSQFVKEGSLTIDGNPVESGSSGNNASSAPSIEQLSGSSYEKGRQIAQFALQYVGYNYSWGGKDPSTGFDCSGLVYYTYQHFGYNINRIAQDQARNGVHVDPSNLQPGDILCFYSGSSYIGHSGIYIGDGKFVHAQNSATGVVITDLSGHYAERGFEARRVVS